MRDGNGLKMHDFEDNTDHMICLLKWEGKNDNEIKGIFGKGLPRDDEVYLKRSDLHSCRNVASRVADLSFELLTKICGSTPER